MRSRLNTVRYEESSVVKSVVQEETTGCGIASVANILGKTYAEMKEIANAMGIYASDKSLWSDTQYVRRMLSAAGIEASLSEAGPSSLRLLRSSRIDAQARAG